MFGAHPRVVERRRDQIIVAVDFVIADVDRAFVAAQQHLGPTLAALMLEARIKPVERDLGRIARRELDRPGDAEALLVVRDFAVARDARMEGERDRIASRAWPIGAARIGGGPARRTIDRVEARLRPANRIIAEFERLLVRIGGRHGKTERAGIVDPAEQSGDARADFFGEVVIAALRRQRGGEAALARERVAGVEVDDGAERAFVEFGRRGLVDDDRAEQLRGEDVEVERAVAVRRGAVGRGRDGFEPVDPDAGELRAEPAHGDAAAFAAIALDRDAGNALQRFGEVLVGEFGDIFGDDRVDRGDRLALHVERGTERGAEAGDDDLVSARHRFIGGRSSVLRPSRRGRQNGKRCTARQPGQSANAPHCMNSHYHPPMYSALI
eukprot:Opistho-2@88051